MKQRIPIQSFLVGRLSSFTYLNITQFLGALNDNIYKLLLVFFLIQLEGIDKSARILSLTGATFVLPFLLFSASSGTLADRFSKSTIIVLTKVLELIIMTIGLIGFIYESVWIGYTVLFLLAAQSTIFGPSKYGIIPELVPTEKISKANGLMTSFTFLAIILGTFLASFILDISQRNFIIASILCILFALVGLVTSLGIDRTAPSGSSKRLNVHFIHEIMTSLKFAATQPSLLMAVIGSAYFLFLGSFVQLNIIPFAVQSLHLTDVQGGYLFLMTAIGIGTGSLIAGKLSGKIVELGLVPWAGLGIAGCCYLIDLFAEHLYFILPLVVILGMFGGVYQIPLDSYIQVAAPKDARGQLVAATNFLSFFGVLLASGLIYLISEVLGFSAEKGFTIIGSITLGMTAVLTFQFFDYLTRFLGMVLSRIHFQITFHGTDKIPDTPAVYVCTHTAWNDTLLLLGAQRRRIRFFIEEEQDHNKWMRRLYRMLRVYRIPCIEPLENSPTCLFAIKRSLKRGISVCIFVTNPDVYSEIDKITRSYSFKEILEDPHFPIIPVVIQKGQKNKQLPIFTRLYSKIRVPAEIFFGYQNASSCALVAEDRLEEQALQNSCCSDCP